jgi:phage shock protein PspC (stress-responsive transcriptional regulator)
MKQVININFQGRVVPIEVTAFELLKNYTESLNRHFANEEGKEEIINDIESRIGELFQERLKAGKTCITDDDVNAIIRSMGRPEDFETEQTGNGAYAETENKTQSAFSGTTANQGPKRLFRDENHKAIGGVCSGLANYFGVDVVVVRVIFVVLAITFGFGLIPYLILWIAVPSSAVQEIGSVRKKLYRDNENKIIAGVCSGISNYFGINAWIPRVLFLLPLLSLFSKWNDHSGDFFRISFSPGALLAYIILWLVLPEANTTTEKLEMKGEKVDLNSIKNSIVGEMKGVQERAEKFSKQAGERSKAFGTEAGNVARRTGRSLGDIIAFLFKVFIYFILGCIGFALIVALFAFAIFSIGIFPIKDFVLSEGWQNVYAWGTLIFFIAVPIVGLLTWIIRKIARIRNNSKLMRISFISLWVLGWASFILLLASVSKDFKAGNTLNEQEIYLTNPGINKLEVTSVSPSQKIYSSRWFRFEPFEGLVEDTAFVRNINVHIVKSPNDSFRVTMVKMVNGQNRRYADTLAALMNFNAVQQDSLLILDKGLAINKTDKFRNQRVVITVYVPVGKQVRIDRSVGWFNPVQFDGLMNNNRELSFDGLEEGWESNVDYIMRADGLYTLQGIPADNWKHRDRNKKTTRITKTENGETVFDSLIIDRADANDNYRYAEPESGTVVTSADSIKIIQQKETNRMRDSLERARQQIENQIRKIEDKTKDPTALMINSLPGYNPMLLLK